MIKLVLAVADFVMAPFITLFDFPIVPEFMNEIVLTVRLYIIQGLDILNVFLPISTVEVCVNVFLAVYIVHHAYTLVLWIIRKIPMLGIS